MLDYRNRIVDLLEKCLHLFLEQRIEHVYCGDLSWKDELKVFVVDEYENKGNTSNYKTLYNQINDPNNSRLDFHELDITNIVSLLMYFQSFKKLYDPKYYKSYFFLFQNARNNLTHYIKDTLLFTAEQRRKLYLDQINAVSTIIGFSSLSEKYYPQGDEWKTIYRTANDLLNILNGESWLIPSTTPTQAIPNNADFSELLVAAEAGNVDAQALVGIAYSVGERVDEDADKSYYWLKKAVRGGNSRAKYYLAKCYEKGIATNEDYPLAKKYYWEAAMESVPEAQYHIGIVEHCNQKTENEGKKWIFEWCSRAAKQDYPAAVYQVYLCYKTGLGVEADLDKAKYYLTHYAELCGDNPFAALAEEAEREKRFDDAIGYYLQAKEKGYPEADRMIRRIQRKIDFQKRRGDEKGT